MILVSVGTQLPFDRMVRVVDAWAGRLDGIEVVAQIGRSDYEPKSIKAFPFIPPDKFRELQQMADFHVAHAGMGSILTAMEFGKPIVIMPRDHQRGEHRNGHQLATARRFLDAPGVHVALDETQLSSLLDGLSGLTGTAPLERSASQALTRRLRNFVADDTRSRLGWRRLLPGGGAGQ